MIGGANSATAHKPTGSVAIAPQAERLFVYGDWLLATKLNGRLDVIL